MPPRFTPPGSSHTGYTTVLIRIHMGAPLCVCLFNGVSLAGYKVPERMEWREWTSPWPTLSPRAWSARNSK